MKNEPLEISDVLMMLTFFQITSKFKQLHGHGKSSVAKLQTAKTECSRSGAIIYPGTTKDSDYLELLKMGLVWQIGG